MSVSRLSELPNEILERILAPLTDSQDVLSVSSVDPRLRAIALRDFVLSSLKVNAAISSFQEVLPFMRMCRPVRLTFERSVKWVNQFIYQLVLGEDGTLRITMRNKNSQECFSGALIFFWSNEANFVVKFLLRHPLIETFDGIVEFELADAFLDELCPQCALQFLERALSLCQDADVGRCEEKFPIDRRYTELEEEAANHMKGTKTIVIRRETKNQERTVRLSLADAWKYNRLFD